MPSQGAALPAGFALGVYEVEARVGAGGMGTVYRARDRRLGRVVAVKVLPQGFAASAERRQRFEREARVLASLNHPHISALYDLGREGELDYLVMEHVEGLTLARHLELRRLKVGEVLRYASQIADALASAHAKGVVHRDLKPSNVMVTDEGLVKLLDFGLAKIADPAPVEETRTTLLRAEDLVTGDGAVLGTLPYLSPEQAEGEAVDARSDIFTFGSVLYEMATGVRAFERPTRAATLAAILGEEPRPLRDLAPDAPPELVRIVERCLRKDRDRRLRSMSDLALSLRELKEESESGRAAAPGTGGRRRASRRRVVWGIGLSAAVLTGAAFVSWTLSRGTPANGAKAPLKIVPLTTYPGVQKDPSLSPDGRQVAFSWNGPEERNFDIYAKATAAGPPLRLTTDPAEDVTPAWSPDGGSIAFLRAQGAGRLDVLLIPALGGPERKLGEISIPDLRWVTPPFLSWFPDSQTLVVVDALAGASATALFHLSVRTGERSQLTFPPPGVLGDASAALSPDGRTLAFGRIGHLGEWSWSIHAVAIGTDLRPAGEARQLTRSHRDAAEGHYLAGIAWSADGRRIVYAAGRSLWTLPIARSGVGSDSVPTEVDVGEWPGQPAISRESTRLVYSHGFGGDTDVWRAQLPKPGRKAAPPVRLLSSTRWDFGPRYSPDGRRIAFQSNRGGDYDIWICESDGNRCSPLTAMGSAFTGTPCWSPDGSEVAYYSRVEGRAQIFVIGHEGGAHRQLTADGSSNMFPRWSRDGRWIYFASNRTGTYQVWKAPTEGGDAAQVTRRGGFAASESPDGEGLYYTRSEAPDAPLFRIAVGGGEEARVLPSVVFHNFEVMPEGIYFIGRSGADLALRFHALTDGTTRTLVPVKEGYVGLSVSPDREWALYTVKNPEGANLSLVEGFR